MATLSNPVTINIPKAGGSGGDVRPPVRGDGGGDGSPDYSGRLRRVRLGLVVGLASVTMIFVSLTSAYVVRRGLPTLDEHNNTYVRDWIPVDLPVSLLLVNSFLLFASSVTVELARRQIKRQAALAPISSIPGVSVGIRAKYSLAGGNAGVGRGLSNWAMDGVAGIGGPGLLFGDQRQQFVRVSVDCNARRTSCGWSSSAVLCGRHFPSASAGGSTSHRGGCHRVVLAFHVTAVAVYFWTVVVCEIAEHGRERPRHTSTNI